MYDEKTVEDSLKICKDIKVYYQSNVFQNPNNIFDLDTFLPAAEEQAETSREKISPNEFEKKLEEAVAYGKRIKEQEGKQYATEIAREELQRVAGRGNKSTKEFTVEKEERAQRKWEEKHAKDLMFDEEDFEKEKPLVLRVFVRFLQVIVVVATAYGLAFFITKYVAMHTVVNGTSMESALQDEDHLVVDRISYRFHEPERYDVIVFPFDEKETYIKRIIGLPGETISIENGIIYINGIELEEGYGLEPMMEPANYYPERLLGEDEYFVLGDNRNQSKDSRSEAVGTVKKNTIMGKAVYRVYPLDKIGWLE